MKTVVLIFAALLLTCVSSFGQQLAYESPAGTKYLLYTPPAYSTGSETYPLLISLHGVAEIGDDLSMLTVGGALTPARLIYQNRWPSTRPFIVLSPQLKATAEEPDPEWPANYIEEVVQHAIANFRVDLNRIYITGLSRGGTGVWTYAAAYPNRLAAMVPISGVLDVSTACQIKNIAIWAFHGEADQVIQTFYPIDMAAAINNCQPAGKYIPHVNLLEVREHTGWEEVYNETNGYPIYDWLLKFTRGSSTNTAPYVNAGADRQFMMRSGPLHIPGDYFDSDGTITNVQWTQTAGAALALSNTNNRFLTINNLQTGTFEFQLSVTDDDGVQRSDRVSITIVASSTLPVVTDIVLMNGLTNADIGNLTEGQVIDINAMGLSEINFRAVAINSTLSVRFSVNADQNTRTVSTTPYLIKAANTKPEWEIKPGEYLVCATPYTKGSGTGVAGISQCFKFTVGDGAPNSTCNNLGNITREVWNGVTGTLVTNIPVNTPPSFTRLTSIFETPTNIDDDYGQRLRGYVCPPVSGNYTFWIASNDRSELWLSTNSDPANKVRIASVGTSTAVRAWTTNASQQSAPINLQAGVQYYIEALHKEGVGANDNLAVGWRLPNGAYERPIPGKRLIPFGSTSNPPSVSITSPAAGATFTPPASITINATATANSGTISKVEFFNGATKLGEDLTSPYSFAWTSVPAGSYSLTAKATDSNNLTTTSSAVNVTVNAGTPPTVSLTSPTAGQTFTAPASVSLAATATATNGTITKVEFFNGANKLGEDLTSPYTFSWNSVAGGSYSLTAKATDSNSLTTTSTAVNITVNTPPTVSITSPTNGQSFTAPANIAINATAGAGSGTITKVEFFNGANKLGEDLTSPYTFAWNSVGVGTYSLTAKVTDSNSITVTSSIINITVAAGTPPTVSITAPTEDQTFTAPASIAIAATAAATNGTITKVEFFNGANKLGEDLTSPYTFAWNSVAGGAYVLTAKATDSNTLTTTSTAINITVNTPPTVSITSPTNGQSFTAPANIPINATVVAGSGTITKVEFFNGANKLGEDLTSPYTFAWNSVGVGSYALTAKVTDSNTLSATSSIINITVAAGTPPTVSITAPTEGQSFIAPASISITATAAATGGTVSKVEFFNGANKLGEDLTSPYSFNWTSVPVGSYVITAKATDSNSLSNTSTAVNITVSAGTPPTVGITAPSEGQTFTAPATIPISATAAASNGSVSKVEFFNGANKLGEDLTSPYSFNWTSVPAGSYVLIARATDSNGLTTNSTSVNVTVNPGGATCTASGTIQREFWANITGTAISSIPVNTTPTSVTDLSLFEGPTNVAENYGSRIRGYICPPATGNYIFWIASNDYSELWLSTDNDPANKVKIASVSGYTSVRQWTKYPSQQSANIPLVAGQQYYIEALHKEATGSDNIAVGWQLPDATLERPIPGSRLSPFGPTIPPPTITITSPTPGQVFPDPATIVISANASPGSGTISKVEFYNNTTKIGEDLVAPYSFTWNAVPAGNYTLVAKATDSGGSASASVSVVVSNGSQTCTASGTIGREFWANITGTAISSIPVNTTPTSTSVLTLFEGPTNVAENYGSRIRGYLCAPATGNYTFWIASNDNSELWLSTDDNPANKVKIASVTGYCSVRQWEKYPTQKSALIALVAGQRYYVEALQKEATGSDNLAVGWQLPNATFERPIPGSRLSPFDGAGQAGLIVSESAGPENMLYEGSDVALYPNPLDKSEFTLYLSGVQQRTTEDLATVEIASMTGSKVFNEKIDCFRCSEVKVRMNSNLTPGVYLVHVIIDGKRFVKRLVAL